MGDSWHIGSQRRVNIIPSNDTRSVGKDPDVGMVVTAEPEKTLMLAEGAGGVDDPC